MSLRKNILYGYVRLGLVLALGVLTNRILLYKLGVEGFGVLSICISLTAFASFLTSALAIGGQRNLAVLIGRNDRTALARLYGSLIGMNLALVAGALILSEGLWALGLLDRLNIPSGYREGSNWIFQSVVVAMVVSIMITPFQALLSAFQRFDILALLGVGQAVLTLLATLALYSTDNRIELYSLAYATSWAVALLAFIYSCSFICKVPIRQKTLFDLPLWRENASFSFWSLFGTFGFLCRTQGIALLANQFFGPVASASFGLANQVSNQLGQVGNIVVAAVSPRMAHLEGSGNRLELLRLAVKCNRLASTLLLALLLPLVMAISQIYDIWLVDVPPYASGLTQIVFATLILDLSTASISSAIYALGKIALYQAVLGSILIISVPLAYLLLATGSNLYISAVVGAVMTGLMAGGRLWFARQSFNFCGSVFDKRQLYGMLAILVTQAGLYFIMTSIFSLRMVGLNLICYWLAALFGGAACVLLVTLTASERLDVVTRARKFVWRRF